MALTAVFSTLHYGCCRAGCAGALLAYGSEQELEELPRMGVCWSCGELSMAREHQAAHQVDRDFPAVLAGLLLTGARRYPDADCVAPEQVEELLRQPIKSVLTRRTDHGRVVVTGLLLQDGTYIMMGHSFLGASVHAVYPSALELEETCTESP